MRLWRLGILTAGLVATATAAWLLTASFGTTSSAEEILKRCAEEGNRAACYEKEVPQLYPALSVPDIFDVVREIRGRDATYQFCHVLGHKIGERVVAEDPSRWFEMIPLNPPEGLCSNGYIHGVASGKFRSEVLDDKTIEENIGNFALACEGRDGWDPSALDYAMCYHGLGHLYFFITDANIRKALSVCERTAEHTTGDYRRVCREGVFMTMYQPLEPDDFLLIERMPDRPSTTTVRQYCASFDRDEYEGACLRESWPFYREESKTGDGIAKMCSDQPNAAEERACYESAFSLLGRFSLSYTEQILSACTVTEARWRPLCYEYGARAILEEDRTTGEKAIAFCNSAPEGEREACLAAIAKTATFIFGSSPERERFCKLLPTGVRNRCG